MSANNLDRQPEERLITEIRELKRQLSEIRTLQSQGANAVNLTITPYEEISLNLGANAAAICRFILSNPDGLPIFSSFEYDVCLDTFAEGNVIKSAQNNYADFWDVEHHTSYGFSSFDGSYIQERILIRNRTAAARTFIARGRWRYVVSSGTGSTS